MSFDYILKIARKFRVLSHDHEWVYEDDYAFQRYEMYWNDYLDELEYMNEGELMKEKHQLERQVQESLADEQEIPPMVEDKLKEVKKILDKKQGFGKQAAEYQGKKVKLNDPIRNPPGSNKKFKVYVRDGDKVKKVQFGDPSMEIKRDDKDNRKSFRARHNCDNPGPKTKARYWSCYQWRKGKKVDN